MLEIPESETIARQIREHLTGKVVAEVVVEHSPHRFAFYSAHKERYHELLTGQTLRTACRRGGILEIGLDSHMLYFSDGASPRFYAADKLPAKHQLLLSFTDGTALAAAVQMYGYLGVEPLGRCQHEYWQAAATKPDVFSSDFTPEYFSGLLPEGRGKLSAKAFLATEQRIPGLGNGVLQDILWQAELDPRLDVRDLSGAERAKLYHAVVATLRQMCQQGGRCTEKDLFGVAGGYLPTLYKGSLGSPCPRCGQTIQKANYMGGTVYFCPGCQQR